MANPIHIFHGADTFRSKKQLDKWQKAFLEKYPGGIVQSVDRADSPLSLSEIAGSSSLFANITLWVIVNPFTSGKDTGILDTDSFLEFVGKGTPDEHHVVLWQKGSLDKRLAVTKTILKSEKSAKLKLYEFESLSGSEALKFLATELKDRGLKLNKNAGELILSYCSDAAGQLNSWQAYNAIEQLSSFTQDKDLVTIEDVQAVVPASKHEDVFLPLLRDFAARNTASFYKNLDILLRTASSDHELLGLISALFEQVKNMILVLELSEAGLSLGEIDKKLGYKAGRSRYVLADAKKFKIYDLENLLENILVLEKQIKSSNVPVGISLAGLMKLK